MAITTAAAIIGGAVIAGGSAITSANKAAKATKEGVNSATSEQRRQFDITTDNLASADEFNREQLEKGGQRSLMSLQFGEQRQRAQLDPFAKAGVSALEQQQALLGMGTPEQQQQAFSQFTESPGQQFIRERAQKSLVRNSSAIGGLGGGKVRSALVEQGAGFAAQDFNNQFNRLSDLRSSGQTAATNIGQGALTTAGNKASTQFNTAQQIGAGTINTAARQGQFGQSMATNVGNLAVAGGDARATGIANKNAALQQGIAGVTTGIGMALAPPPPPPSNTSSIGIT